MMKIGLAQMNIVWENKRANFEKAELIIEKFCEWEAVSTGNGGRLILFPEMSLTGFSMNTDVTAEDNRDSVRAFQRLAKEYNVAIGLGWVKAGILCENHYSIISPTEGVISDYTKIHPFSYSEEDKYFSRGNRLVACKLGDMKIGTTICFDLRFPEIFQILSDKVDLIVVPANWPKTRCQHWKTLLPARAIENQCYIAGVNCCGTVGKQYYSGDSALYAPEGIMLKPDCEIRLSENVPEEKLIIYNIENKVESVRKAFPVKHDRRNDLYRKLEVEGL